jgi:hypothetical protein
MNRWWVYEFMKNRYVRTGDIPDVKEVHREFAELDAEEIGEGMAEFYLALHRMIPQSEFDFDITEIIFEEEGDTNEAAR